MTQCRERDNPMVAVDQGLSHPVSDILIVGHDEINTDARHIAVDEYQREPAFAQFSYQLPGPSIVAFYPGDKPGNTALYNFPQVPGFRHLIGLAAWIVGDYIDSRAGHAVHKTFRHIAHEPRLLREYQRDRISIPYVDNRNRLRKRGHVGTASAFTDEIPLRLKVTQRLARVVPAQAQLPGKLVLGRNPCTLRKITGEYAAPELFLDLLCHLWFTDLSGQSLSMHQVINNFRVLGKLFVTSTRFYFMSHELSTTVLPPELTGERQKDEG